MRILLLGEYSNVHATLAKGLRTLGHEVTVLSNGDFWKNYPRDIDLVRTYTKLGGISYLLRLLRILPRLKGYDIVQLINPMFLELKAERIFPIYHYLRKHNKKVVLGAYGMDYYWVKTCCEEKPLRYSDFNIGKDLRNTADALPVANGGTGSTTVADVKATFGISDLETALGGVKIISTLISANNGTKIFKFTGTCAFSLFTSGADATIRSHTHGYCTGAGAVTQTKQPSGATGISFTNATNKMTVKNESQYTMFVVLIAYGNPDHISLQE